MMENFSRKSDTVIKIRVKTGYRKFLIEQKGEVFDFYVTNKPEKGLANREIIENLRKMLGKEVVILSGLKSSKKLVQIKGMTQEEFIHCINKR